jgi:hypothetical protein
MKLSRIDYLLFAIALAFASLQLSGTPVAAAGGSSPAFRSGRGSQLGLIKGSYSGLFSGNVVGSPMQPFAGTGLFISDGRGNLSGHETVNFSGNACDYQISGTYTVNSDGTRTDEISFINGSPGCASGSFTQSLVVADGGNLILLSNTNSPDVATEHWYRAGAGDF